MPLNQADIDESKKLVQHLPYKAQVAALLLSLEIVNFTSARSLCLVSQGFTAEESVLIGEAALALSVKGTGIGIKEFRKLGII